MFGQQRILAITFTNKAANEMKERVRNMLASQTSAPWVSTIHSLCVRILREDIIAMGYPRNFTIMDTEDQKSVLKEAYKLQGIDATTYSYGLCWTTLPIIKQQILHQKERLFWQVIIMRIK